MRFVVCLEDTNAWEYFVSDGPRRGVVTLDVK